MRGKYFKRKHRISKHMQINYMYIMVPGQRYEDSRHLLQNPKVFKTIVGFNNHAQRSTPPYYLNVDNPFEKINRENLKCGFQCDEDETEGLRDQGKYKLSNDYWKNWSLV